MDTHPQLVAMTLRDFALRINVCRNTVRAWIVKGMPVIRQGRVLRIPLEKADCWLGQHVPQTRPARVPREQRVPIRKALATKVTEGHLGVEPRDQGTP